MFKQNLDWADRILRFALAIWWLGPFAPAFASPMLNTLVYLLGWLALFESMFDWCWLLENLGVKRK